MISHNTGHLPWVLSAAVDLVLAGGAVLWAARAERPLGRSLTVAVTATLLIWGAKTLVLLSAGLEVPFGLLHVVWLDLVVVLPAAALLFLVLTRHGAALPLRVVAGLLVLLAPVGAYASFMEPERVVVERAEVRPDPARTGSEPLRVGLIADLQVEQVRDRDRRAVRRLLDERPDLILLAGDHHQGSAERLERELPGLRDLFRQLRAPGGVFSVQGDVENVPEARRITRGTGARLLVNDLVRVRVRDRRVTIAGLELRFGSRAAAAATRRLERARGAGDVRLLLAHRPDVALRLRPDTRVDLVLAGHTHGGQFQFPLLGPPHIASRVPRDVGAGGLHSLGGRRLYVSRGLGVERGQAPRLRLGATPEVTLLTLR